jgi:hypothetical protein
MTAGLMVLIIGTRIIGRVVVHIALVKRGDHGTGEIK